MEGSPKTTPHNRKMVMMTHSKVLATGLKTGLPNTDTAVTELSTLPNLLVARQV